MQQINLSQNKIALLDDEDFARFSQFRWCYRGERNGAQGYAIRHVKMDNGTYKTEYLHRAIMNPEPGKEVIFLNHDRLDCRRANLRVVTTQDARRHHRVRCDSKSGVKGVSYNPEYRTWSADIYRDGICYRIGTFYCQEEAVAAYEFELRRENPDLAGAPTAIDRSQLPLTGCQGQQPGRTNADGHNPDRPNVQGPETPQANVQGSEKSRTNVQNGHDL